MQNSLPAQVGTSSPTATPKAVQSHAEQGKSDAATHLALKILTALATQHLLIETPASASDELASAWDDAWHDIAGMIRSAVRDLDLLDIELTRGHSETRIHMPEAEGYPTWAPYAVAVDGRLALWCAVGRYYGAGKDEQFDLAQCEKHERRPGYATRAFHTALTNEWLEREFARLSNAGQILAAEVFEAGYNAEKAKRDAGAQTALPDTGPDLV